MKRTYNMGGRKANKPQKSGRPELCPPLLLRVVGTQAEPLGSLAGMRYLLAIGGDMLLFDDGKRLEKAVGEDAAAIIIKAFEHYDETLKKELVTRGNLREMELRLMAEIEKTKAEIQRAKAETLRWIIGLMVAQGAAIIGGIAALIK